MINLPFSLSKIQQILDSALKRIENTQNDEDKINEIDRTWHQLYGMKSILESGEVELMQKAAKNNNFQEYSEFTKIRELIYQRMMQMEEMYENALTQQGKSPKP